MLDKIDYALKNQQFNRRSEEYGYISPDEAAYNTNGTDKAYTERKGLFEYIKKLFNGDSPDSENSDDDDTGENTNENGGETN